MNTYREFVSFLCNGLIHHPHILNLSQVLEHKPHIIDLYCEQLESAIKLFNTQSKDGSLPTFCINSIYTSKVLEGKELPSFSESMKELVNGLSQVGFLDEMNQFEFIDKFEDSTCLFGALLVASYRTYLLVKNPDLRHKNVQIASTIEEMLCIHALDGNVMNLFYSVKDWVLDYKGEGFSEELAKKIEYNFA